MKLELMSSTLFGMRELDHSIRRTLRRNFRSRFVKDNPSWILQNIESEGDKGEYVLSFEGRAWIRRSAERTELCSIQAVLRVRKRFGSWFLVNLGGLLTTGDTRFKETLHEYPLC